MSSRSISHLPTFHIFLGDNTVSGTVSTSSSYMNSQRLPPYIPAIRHSHRTRYPSPFYVCAQSDPVLLVILHYPQCVLPKGGTIIFVTKSSDQTRQKGLYVSVVYAFTKLHTTVHPTLSCESSFYANRIGPSSGGSMRARTYVCVHARASSHYLPTILTHDSTTTCGWLPIRSMVIFKNE